MAGLTAFGWGGTSRILALWVHENWRRHGYGSQLLTVSEQEVLARGCQLVVVETYYFSSSAVLS
jgi:GNAT superfamily N-acetyltransferase